MACAQARTRKVEAESKLAGLQQDLAELGNVSGDQLGAEEAETTRLHQEIATAEGKKAALQMSAAAVREEHGLLQKELESLQLTVEAAKADVTNAQQNLRSLRDKVRCSSQRAGLYTLMLLKKRRQ